MTTALVPAREPNRRTASFLDVVALEYGNRLRTIGIPLIILAATVVLTVIITAAVLRAGGGTTGASYNSGIPLGVAGFIGTLGVQNVTATFPLALALGSTRRAFVLGVLATAVLQSLLVTVAAEILLVLETLTDGWFVGAKALRVELLGNGDPLVLAAVLFLGLLVVLSLAGVFGASFVRFGATGPTVLGLAVVLAAAIALLVVAPALGALVTAFRPWWSAVVAATLIAAASAGEYVLLRRASVR